MAEKYKVSVIIPVYNTEKYIERCLASIINQNLKEIEIIVVNDSSLDKSLEIIKQFMKQDERIKLINKKKNEGLSAARNSGIQLAAGEFILHIDSDDWIEQDYIKNMYELAKEKNAEVVVTDFYTDYDNGVIKYEVDQKTLKDCELKREEAINNICLSKARPAIWNKLIKRELYTENNLFHPEGISIGEDLFITPKIFYYANKIFKHNKAYLHYIQNANSLTNQKTEKLTKLFDIYHVLKNLEDFFGKQKQFFDVEQLKINHLTIWLFRTRYDFKNKEYCKIIDEYFVNFKRIPLKKLKMLGNILRILNNKIKFIIMWNVYSSYIKLKTHNEVD